MSHAPSKIPPKLIAQSENGTLRYVHQDSLSSTSLMTDNSGNQIGDTVKYLPFGETRMGSVPTDKLFTGQRLDGTGLYYYNARYYDPTIGRFISPDTVIPNMANPQCFNRYSYCLNNPLKYTDPSGHDMVDMMLLGIMATSGASASDVQAEAHRMDEVSNGPSMIPIQGWIDFGLLTLYAWRRNILTDASINKTGGIRVGESNVNGTVFVTNQNGGTFIGLSLFGNNIKTNDDSHSPTTIVPDTPRLTYKTASGTQGQIKLGVPEDLIPYFNDRNRNTSPEYWNAYTSADKYIPSISDCTEMKITITFHTADPSGWDWEGQPSYTRPYGFIIDLITNEVEILS